MINAKPRGFLFNEVSIDTPERSAFDMSFENRLSLDFGEIVPTLVEEVLPGDTFNINSNYFVRFAPLIAPLMHKVDLFVYTFFVPNRLIWDEWREFISPGDGKRTMVQLASKDYTAPVPPHFVAGDDFEWEVGELADYLGVQGPRGTNNDSTSNFIFGGTKINALPFRAYHLICDEYFRDQNLEEPTLTNFGSGSLPSSEFGDLAYLRYKCYEHDYFTSALPTPQRGPDVFLPLGDEAPLKFDGGSVYDGTIAHGAKIAGADSNLGQITFGSGNLKISSEYSGGHVAFDVTKYTKVDLREATSVTINTVRLATRLQSFLEKSARVGGRYIESILAHFGVHSSDARLQRPELISAKRIPISVSAVTAESASSIDVGGSTLVNAQGTQTGQMQGNGNDFVDYTAEEHGFIIQVCSVIPRTSYDNGIKRMFTRRETYLDYAWPEFGHLGEQEVYTNELYGNSRSDQVFGYQSRYAEYKYHADEVHGDFTNNLSFWTMTRRFRNAPNLNKLFVQVRPTKESGIFQPFAVTSSGVDHIFMDVWHDSKALRCLPLYGTPTL